MCCQGGCNQDSLQREGRGLELGWEKGGDPQHPKDTQPLPGESSALAAGLFHFLDFHHQENHSLCVCAFLNQRSNSAFSGLLEAGLRKKQGMLSLAKPLLTLTHITSFRFTSTELPFLEQLLEKRGKNQTTFFVSMFPEQNILRFLLWFICFV